MRADDGSLDDDDIMGMSFEEFPGGVSQVGSRAAAALQQPGRSCRMAGPDSPPRRCFP
jgi:hypothetical protein